MYIPIVMLYVDQLERLKKNGEKARFDAAAHMTNKTCVTQTSV